MDNHATSPIFLLVAQDNETEQLFAYSAVKNYRIYTSLLRLIIHFKVLIDVLM